MQAITNERELARVIRKAARDAGLRHYALPWGCNRQPDVISPRLTSTGDCLCCTRARVNAHNARKQGAA